MGGAPCKNSRHDTYLSMRVTLCNEVRWRSFLSLPAPPSFRCSCVPSGAFKVSSPAFGVKHHRLTLESSVQRAARAGHSASFVMPRRAATFPRSPDPNSNLFHVSFSKQMKNFPLSSSPFQSSDIHNNSRGCDGAVGRLSWSAINPIERGGNG